MLTGKAVWLQEILILSLQPTKSQKLFAVLRKSYDHLSANGRLMCLDAVLVLRGCPASHLTAVWEGAVAMHDSDHQQHLREILATPESAAEWQRRRCKAAASDLLAHLIDLSIVTVVEQSHQSSGADQFLR